MFAYFLGAFAMISEIYLAVSDWYPYTILILPCLLNSISGWSLSLISSLFRRTFSSTTEMVTSSCRLYFWCWYSLIGRNFYNHCCWNICLAIFYQTVIVSSIVIVGLKFFLPFFKTLLLTSLRLVLGHPFFPIVVGQLAII